MFKILFSFALSLFLISIAQAKYEFAGVLPIVKIKNKVYVALEKIPELKQIALHGEFSGMKSKKDIGRPLLTAARSFSNKADIKYKDTLDLFKEQCKYQACAIKSKNNKDIIFPLIVTPDILDDMKVPFVLANLDNLQNAINTGLSKKKLNNIYAVAQGGAIIKLKKELVEALISSLKTKNNIFKVFSKLRD